MAFQYNPLTGNLDLVGSASSGDIYITNNLQIDQSGGTNDSYGAITGSINGSNTNFTVSNSAYVTGTLSVYLNGQLLTQGDSEDWVEATPGSGTFTFNTAPLAGDQITVAYMTQETGSFGGGGGLSHGQVLARTLGA